MVFTLLTNQSLFTAKRSVSTVTQNKNFYMKCCCEKASVLMEIVGRFNNTDHS